MSSSKNVSGVYFVKYFSVQNGRGCLCISADMILLFQVGMLLSQVCDTRPSCYISQLDDADWYLGWVTLISQQCEARISAG
jgi:hypothetical protein